MYIIKSYHPEKAEQYRELQLRKIFFWQRQRGIKTGLD